MHEQPQPRLQKAAEPKKNRNRGYEKFHNRTHNRNRGCLKSHNRSITTLNLRFFQFFYPKNLKMTIFGPKNHQKS